MAALLLASVSGSMVAQTQASLVKRYGKAEATGKNRWTYQVRPKVSLTVIFSRNGKPALMKLASRIDGQVINPNLADEIIHELWSARELVEDKNGLKLSISYSQCNGEEYATYRHFTIKTFRGCSTKSESLEAGVDSLEVTWKKMSRTSAKTWVLAPDPKLH